MLRTMTIAGALTGIALCGPAMATAFNWTGNGANTLWNNDDNWDQPGFPADLANDSASIGDSFQVDITSFFARTNSASLGSNSLLNLNNNSSLSLGGGGFANDGSISLNAGANLAQLTFQGSQGLTGSGTLFMGDSANNVVGGLGAPVITHGANHTIRGGGRLLNNSAGMVNQGAIIADQAITLVVEPGNAGFVNQGTVRAQGAGGLHFTNGSFTNTGQTIEIMDGSKLRLQGMTLTGGTLQTGGSGVIFNEQGHLFTFDGVTVNGTLSQANSSTATIRNDLIHSGTWSLNAAANESTISFIGDQTIGGTGTIVMGDNALNRIRGTSGDPLLTHAAGHTIRGAGQLLFNSAGMVNQGTIIADQATTLVVEPGSAGFVNQGTVRAQGAGGLMFTNGSFTNAGHTIEVLDGSKLELRGLTLNGGALQASGSGFVFIETGGHSTLDGVTMNAPMQQANFNTVTVRNGLTNNGNWFLNATANPTEISFDGDQTIGGTGTIVMGDNVNNRVRATGGNPTLTHGADHTIRGAGQLLFNSAGMVNQGTIIADQATRLVIEPGGAGFVNQGTVRAQGAGGLFFTNGSFTNTGHTVEILDGSKLELRGLTLTGGTLQASGSGFVFIETGGHSTLDGVTMNAPMQQANFNTVTVRNGLTNNGTWSLNTTANPTEIAFQGAQTLSGSGSIMMGDNVLSRIVTNNTLLTQAAGHTIRGAGTLLANGGGLLNQGAIIADQATAMTIDPGFLNFVNQGSLMAIGAGGIDLEGATSENQGQVTIGDSRIDVTTDYLQTAGHTQLMQATSLLNSTGTVSIQGGRLSGIGTVAGVTSNTGGTVAAGNSAGILFFDGDFNQSSGGTTEVELFGFALGTEHDFYDVTGQASLAGVLDILLGTALAAVLQVGDEFEIMMADGGISSLYETLTVNLAGYLFEQDLRGNSLFLVTTQVAAPPPPSGVPEPATLVLFGLPLAGLLIVRRRRRP